MVYDNIKDIPAKTLRKMFELITKIRKVELKIEELYHEDEMKTPVHLSLGQEAVSAGICAHLSKSDYVFSNHRSHAHYIAKGGDIKKMIAELYCKETGCSKGRGGSMHLIDVSVGLFGSSSIVGGSIPHAVGAALASVMRKEDRISVSFFGDAAVEEGVLYESMNLAALKKLPVIFVCENNYYSVCSQLCARQANDDISMRPRAFGIPSLKVDGMDVIEVYRKFKEAIDHVKDGKGPFFLECVVQRWCGHAGAGDPSGPKYRRPQDLDPANIRYPIKEFKATLLQNNILSEKDIESINKSIDKDVLTAFEFGQKSHLPDRKELTKYLYC